MPGLRADTVCLGVEGVTPEPCAACGSQLLPVAQWWPGKAGTCQALVFLLEKGSACVLP